MVGHLTDNRISTLSNFSAAVVLDITTCDTVKHSNINVNMGNRNLGKINSRNKTPRRDQRRLEEAGGPCDPGGVEGN